MDGDAGDDWKKLVEAQRYFEQIKHASVDGAKPLPDMSQQTSARAVIHRDRKALTLI